MSWREILGKVKEQPVHILGPEHSEAAIGGLLLYHQEKDNIERFTLTAIANVGAFVRWHLTSDTHWILGTMKGEAFTGLLFMNKIAGPIYTTEQDLFVSYLYVFKEHRGDRRIAMNLIRTAYEIGEAAGCKRISARSEMGAKGLLDRLATAVIGYEGAI